MQNDEKSRRTVGGADPEAQIRAITKQMAAASSGHTIGVFLRAHLYCLLKAAVDRPKDRATVAKALRDIAAEVDGLGTSEGDQVKQSVRSLLERMIPPPGKPH